MKQNNNLWKFLFVLFIIGWSFYQMYPPRPRDLIQQFAARAENRDTTFSNILARADALQAAGTNSEFANLRAAIGTNDIQQYFSINATNELDPTTYLLNRIQRDAAGKIKLGLDLQGGTAFVMQMGTNALQAAEGSGSSTNGFVSPEATSGAIAQAVDVLRNRVDQFGVAEPTIQPQGANQILIELPGLSEADKESAKENLERPAFLEFRMVKADSSQIVNPSTGQTLQAIPPGFEVMKLVETHGNAKPSVEYLVVRKKAEDNLQGAIVKSARMGRGMVGEPLIEFQLTDQAAKAFAKVTRENIGRRMAIVLDGQLYSAPSINNEIDGSGEITGSFTVEEAQKLAAVLQNPLSAPLSLLYSYDVDPTLGKDSIHSGIQASLWAVILVSAFMLIYYRVAGLTANIALITNIIILLGVMCSVGTTFTLPGIAGVVLTIGMAVDANVLIYERLREELAKGKSLRGAIAAGYARAFGTIFDSHVTTLISSVILIFMGTGEIKGFGVTLTIGVAASLFTALVVTRLIFDFLLDRNWLKSLGMFHLIRATSVNFMAAAKPLFILTWVFAITALLYGGFFRGAQMFGVDFRGGDSTTFTFAQRVDDKDLRAALAGVGLKDVQIQYQKNVSGGAENLRVTSANNTGDEVKQVLEQKFPQAKFSSQGTKSVGATIGADVRNSAIIASLMALFGILVYVAFRYEFSFAVGAIVAVIHDVLLTVGCFCIANGISGRQFNTTVVAAVLTIIGFSINDKVVIFDRIREDLKLGMRGTFNEIINAALNQTLSRTIITSGTVFLATGSLYIFGGGAINDFAFTFLIGIVTGTYSSIYIASAFVLWWHKGQRPNIGASAVKVQEAAPAKA
jgi:SecD/SecF fusion protein